MLISLLRAIRIHQWSKNGLIFVPLITSHTVWPLVWWPRGLAALAAFSACASATYLFNDLLDRESDRAHPTKRFRPVASGTLLPGPALIAAAGLLIIAFALGAWLGNEVVALLGLYLALTVTYSTCLKRFALLDVLVLAALYTLRVMAGHVIFGVRHSEWLLAFIVFLFLGLALVKRYSELLLMRSQPAAHFASRRGYVKEDASLVRDLGIASSFTAVLVFALYINSGAVRGLYRHPDLLWLAVPVVLYWLARVWRVAHHGRMDADPVIFALRDPGSYIAGLLLIAVLVTASGALG